MNRKGRWIYRGLRQPERRRERHGRSQFGKHVPRTSALRCLRDRAGNSFVISLCTGLPAGEKSRRFLPPAWYFTLFTQSEKSVSVVHIDQGWKTFPAVLESHVAGWRQAFAEKRVTAPVSYCSLPHGRATPGSAVLLQQMRHNGRDRKMGYAALAGTLLCVPAGHRFFEGETLR